MKFSIGNITVLLLQLVASSSLHQKGHNINSNIDDNAKSISLTWQKEELARKVQELRVSEFFNTQLLRNAKIEMFLMEDEFSEVLDDAYRERLCQKILSFVTEAEQHGLEIGGSVRALLRKLKRTFHSTLVPFLMNSENVEVKAATLSIWGKTSKIWNKYYPLIENDEQVQIRLLRLIQPSIFTDSTQLLMNWGASIDSSIKPVIECPKSYFMMRNYVSAFPLYVTFCLEKRGMRVKDVVFEFLHRENFRKLVTKLAAEYDLPEAAAILDVFYLE